MLGVVSKAMLSDDHSQCPAWRDNHWK